MNGRADPHVCDVCGLDLAHELEYFYCSECPATFFWCLKCFYTTSIRHNDPAEIPRLNADPDRYGGRVVTSTRSWHIHKFVHYKLDIKTKPVAAAAKISETPTTGVTVKRRADQGIGNSATPPKGIKRRADQDQDEDASVNKPAIKKSKGDQTEAAASGSD
jgi:hypothetical protein